MFTIGFQTKLGYALRRILNIFHIQTSQDLALIVHSFPALIDACQTKEEGDPLSQEDMENSDLLSDECHRNGRPLAHTGR